VNGRFVLVKGIKFQINRITGLNCKKSYPLIVYLNCLSLVLHICSSQILCAWMHNFYCSLQIISETAYSYIIFAGSQL